MTESALNRQEGGDHYKRLGQYQPWEVLKHWLTPEELKGFAKGTAISYLAREEQKGGRLDIQKAIHTLQLYLELTEDAVARPTEAQASPPPLPLTLRDIIEKPDPLEFVRTNWRHS